MKLLFNPYLEMTAFAFLLMLTVYFTYKERLHTPTNVIYNYFLFIVLIGLALDIIGTYTLTYIEYLPLNLNYSINTSLFIFMTTMPVMFWLLTMSMTNRLPQNLPGDKVKVTIMLIPFIVLLCAINYNVFSHWFYYFDSELNYFHGHGFYLLIVGIAFYLLCGAYNIIRYRKSITSIQFLTIILYLLIVSFSMIIQHIFPYHLVMPVAVALGLFSMYFTFQNPDYYIDKMTGLYGREAFMVITQQLLDSKKTDRMVVFININNFKRINNLFGMRFGDGLIYSVSNYLTKISLNKRNLFRIDGDKFILLVNSQEADNIVKSIRHRFTESWPVLDTKLFVTVNICIMPVSCYAKSSEELMMFLSNAMAMSKHNGENVVFEINNDIVSEIERKLRIENILTNLEYNKCLSLYWQPIYNVHKQRFTAVEVLLRMYDQELGYVPADEFIEVSERKGLICSIGHYVLQQACQFISANNLAGLGIEKVDINLSPAECIQENLVENISETLTRFPIAPLKLDFEITETTAAMSIKDVKTIMEKLSAEGVEFSLDDYGRGYSNNDVILKLPFNAVKIDKTLLWDALNNYKARTVLKNSIRMLKEMQLKIVAEGAETQEQVDYLLAIGVDYIQGYYFSCAVSGDNLLRLLKDQKEYSLHDIWQSKKDQVFILHASK